MKRLLMACLLAAFSHGVSAELDPECYRLYDMFTKLDSVATIARSNIAGEMLDRQCWPALQDGAYTQPAVQPQPVISTCNDLVPHIIQLVENQTDLKILKVYDPKPMNYETIDKVAGGHDVFQIVTDNRGRSARVRQSLKHDDKVYVRGQGHYKDAGWAQFGAFAPPDAPTYGDKGTVLVPNSEPFLAGPPTGTQRVLNCSAEARYTDGLWLIQMHLDRDSGGEEFIGMAGLMELR